MPQKQQIQLSTAERRAKQLQVEFRQWLGTDFKPQYFVTLTASKSQSEDIELFKKLVNLFVNRLNRQLYQRQYSKGRRLKVCYILEPHKDGTFHCHMIIGGITGDEYLKGHTFEQVAKSIWSNKIHHEKGYGISDVKDVYDGTGLYDYINKKNWKFTPEYFDYPR